MFLKDSPELLKPVYKPEDAEFTTISDKYAIHLDKVMMNNNKTGVQIYVGIVIATQQKIFVKKARYEVYKNYQESRSQDPLTFDKFVKEYEREYQIGRLCDNHPHIVPTLDMVVKEKEQSVYIITPFYDGYVPLQLWWQRHRVQINHCEKVPLKERCAIEFTRQLVSAIMFLHNHNISHGDIKMMNMIVCPREPIPAINRYDGFKEPKYWRRNNVKSILNKNPMEEDWHAPCIKILDFGFSAGANMDKDSYHNMSMGSAYWMGPENFKKEIVERPGTVNDLWAVGVFHQMMLTGLIPFTFKGAGKGQRITGTHIQMVLNTEPLAPKWYSSRKLRPQFHLTKDYQDFLKRTFRRSWCDRMRIWELANHPFLGAYKKEVSWKTVYDPQTAPAWFWFMLPICWKIKRQYPPITAYQPDYETYISNSISTIDMDILKNTHEMGYGWNAFTKHKDEPFTFDQMREKVETGLAKLRMYQENKFGRFPNAETALYCYQLYLAKIGRRPSVVSMISIGDDAKEPTVIVARVC